MKTLEKKFFIGIDLGWKEKKTTGLCILKKEGQKIFFEESYCKKCQDIFGKDILKIIRSYLKNTAVIAIDAPLTRGRGKGKMRLYEKFLSTKIFRQERVTPIPPALMPKLCDFAQEIRKKLEKRGFVLDINLIEVFPTLTKKLMENSFFKKIPCQTENQKSAFICAILAYLHFNFQTRYLGYKDGFLFLPQMSFWKKDWRKKFYQAWMDRDRLKYRHLITNVFLK
jgi:predicted nuclease with RNAse H fold